MCIAKNFARRQKPVFTNAETNNVNYIKDSTVYTYSKSLFESSQTDWGEGALSANTALLSRGSCSLRGFTYSVLITTFLLCFLGFVAVGVLCG